MRGKQKNEKDGQFVVSNKILKFYSIIAAHNKDKNEFECADLYLLNEHQYSHLRGAALFGEQVFGGIFNFKSDIPSKLITVRMRARFGKLQLMRRSLDVKYKGKFQSFYTYVKNECYCIRFPSNFSISVDKFFMLNRNRNVQTISLKTFFLFVQTPSLFVEQYLLLGTFC